MSFVSLISQRQKYIPFNAENDKIHKNVISGGIWSGIDVGFNVLLSFVRSIILARLLFPRDFGIVSIAMVFTQFILIFTNFGFTASVIYHRDLTREDISTCWWGNIIVDTIAASIAVFIAFLSKRFISSPEIPWIILLLSLQFIIISAGSINLALLQRNFYFKKITIIKIIGSMVGLVSTIGLIIVYHLGVYALAIGMVLFALVNTSLYMIYMPWFPSLVFSLQSAKKHLKYGGWFLGVNVITYINGNIDKMSIGAFLNNTQLGFFEYASRFPAMVVTNLGQVFNKVLFPAFSSLQNDKEKLNTIIRDLYRFNSIIVFPMLAGLGMVAHEFVVVLYGMKWLPVVVPMQIMCGYGILKLLSNPLFPMANGIGKPHLPFKWTLMMLPINAIAFYFLIKYYGLNGVAFAKYAMPAFMIVMLGSELFKLMTFRKRILFFELIPAIISTAIMAIGLQLAKLFLFRQWINETWFLPVEVVLGAAIYVGALVLFFKKDFDRLLRLALKFVKR